MERNKKSVRGVFILGKVGLCGVEQNCDEREGGWKTEPPAGQTVG